MEAESEGNAFLLTWNPKRWSWDDLEEDTKTKLSDLAIVCANCHAMIHRGGQYRPMEAILVRSH